MSTIWWSPPESEFPPAGSSWGATEMFIDLTPEQHALRDEIRDYLGRLITPELKEALREHAATPVYKQVIRQMGRDGFLAIGWPTEHGGRGFGSVEQFIFVREVLA